MINESLCFAKKANRVAFRNPRPKPNREQQSTVATSSAKCKMQEDMWIKSRSKFVINLDNSDSEEDNPTSAVDQLDGGYKRKNLLDSNETRFKRQRMGH
jgi:hypothetical protein